ncbi:MAG: dihydroorotase [Gammaproteobacteria bacterium]|nr:dihydroorotase [Gammaproteobacteria bacterium]
MSSLLIQNARIARADGSLFEGDLLCRDGRIARMDAAISATADETLDAGGQLLLPGVIDPQVHFREPGGEEREDLASGSLAAVAGGVTSFLEMPNTRPATTTQAALDDKLHRAKDRSLANYGFFIGATPHNLDEINHAAPACGIKVFMGSSTGDLLVSDPEDLERIFANGSRLIAVHAEDEARINARQAQFAGRTDYAAHSEIRDAECARLATALALELSIAHRRRLHVLHLSTKEEVELLRQDKPAWVTAEVIPNHLLLNTADYAELGSLVQMNPPIREAEDNDALWQALHDGVLDFIATDHAPHRLEDKQKPYPGSPSGMPGVQTSLPLIFTAHQQGRCTLAELQRWMCSGPADGYGIPNKGHIAEGRDADLVLVDAENYREVRNRDMRSRVGWSPFAGRKLTGWPLYTIVGGRVVYDHGDIRPGVFGQALAFEPGDNA